MASRYGGPRGEPRGEETGLRLGSGVRGSDSDGHGTGGLVVRGPVPYGLLDGGGRLPPALWSRISGWPRPLPRRTAAERTPTQPLRNHPFDHTGALAQPGLLLAASRVACPAQRPPPAEPDTVMAAKRWVRSGRGEGRLSARWYICPCTAPKQRPRGRVGCWQKGEDPSRVLACHPHWTLRRHPISAVLTEVRLLSRSNRDQPTNQRAGLSSWRVEAPAVRPHSPGKHAFPRICLAGGPRHGNL